MVHFERLLVIAGKKIRELVLHHDHRRLKELPFLFKKFKGDEARLHDLLYKALIEGNTAVEAELGKLLEGEALEGTAMDAGGGASGPLLRPHQSSDGSDGWTRLDAIDPNSEPLQRSPELEGEDGEVLPEFTVRKLRQGAQKLLRVAVVMPKVNDVNEVTVAVGSRQFSLSNVHYRTLAFTGEDIDAYVGTAGIEIVVGEEDEEDSVIAEWELSTRTLTVDLPLVFKRSDGQSFDLA
jgi:hypothetical protein